MRSALTMAGLLLTALSLSACQPKTDDPSSAHRIDRLGGVDLTANLSVIGTEPFWALTLTDDQITLEGPGKEPAQWPRPEFLSSENYQDGSRSAELVADELTLVLSAKPCTDGMSDRKYPLTAEATLGDEVLTGCAIATSDLETFRP